MSQVFGDSLSSFYSLFMIPGGGHCGAIPGYPQVPGTYHVLDQLVPWVEEGKIPQSLLLTDPPNGSNGTMTLLPYQ
jgi:feruloyl esterase